MVQKVSILILPIVFLSCDGESSVKAVKSQPPKTNVKSSDTTLLAESHNEQDLVLNDYMKEQLAPIRANFKRINSIDEWSLVLQKDLYQSTEGGYVCFYYFNDQIEKIVERNFGESGQNLTEFYLLNGELSFVLERSYNYNRPLYWDSTQMKENNDTEAFNFEQSEIMEDRSYFIKGKMVHTVVSGDCGSPFNQEYLDKEGKRLKSELKKLMLLAKH
jgi:hypothetical protein